MRRIAMVVVAAAGCSFPGNGDVPQDGNPQGIDAADPPPVIDGPDIDAPVIDARRIDAFQPPDASPPDAGFSIGLCGAAYSLTSGSSPGSRYRVIAATEVFALHHADCNNDLPNGWTHLVTFGSDQEAQDAAGFTGAQYFYVGAVQDPAANTLAGGWRWFDNTIIGAGEWQTGGPIEDQPDDSNGTENGQESLAVAETNNGELHDVAGLSEYAAICECDGIPIDPTVESWIP